jgi:ribosome-associated protein
MQQEIVSKTRRKQQMLALQALGAALVELSETQIAELTLESALREAVLDAKRMRTHEARRRQLQYIGRLMRELDAEPIRAQLAAIQGHSAQESARHRRLETWRERLLADESALTEFATEHPAADLQKLRNLIRSVRKDRDENKAPRAYRELFRCIKECSDSNPS